MTSPLAGRHALARLSHLVHQFEPGRDALAIGGAVTEIGAGYCRVAGLGRHASIADVLVARSDASPHAEIIHVGQQTALAAPYHLNRSLELGAQLFRRGPIALAPAQDWLGRVVDAFGAPIDGMGPLSRGPVEIFANATPPQALHRRIITKGLTSGVKTIDLFAPLCIGQRIGIFAGSGVGKSTLLGMLAAAENFDVVVIGLIGERGREVREFIEHTLGARRHKSVLVVATSDESALLRRLAARTTMAIAESFRDQGRSVLVILDSVTRFALACREVAIAAGEPPVSRGFPPSVFTDLPRLLERAGPGPQDAGDITAIFSVLVDGDDHNDPIADAVRGIVDGHIVLDRSIAAQGRYPAIDIPASLSRLAHVALTPDRQAIAQKLRAMVARFEDSRDLRTMGGYRAGVDTELDAAVAIVPLLYANLVQSGDSAPCQDAFREVTEALKRQTAGAE